MPEDKNLSRVLKWIGVAALAAVPIFFIVKKIASSHSAQSNIDDDADIFSEDLAD